MELITSLNNETGQEIKVVLSEKKFNEVKEMTNNFTNEVKLTIQKPYARRSLDANAYMWLLCSRIAKILGHGATKEDVYIEQIRRGNEFEIVLVKKDMLEKVKQTWEARGVGWVAEHVGEHDDRYSNLVLYTGSSVYDTKAMSDLIERVIFEAKNLGVDTKTPKEINDLIDLWEKRSNKHE